MSEKAVQFVNLKLNTNVIRFSLNETCRRFDLKIISEIRNNDPDDYDL